MTIPPATASASSTASAPAKKPAPITGSSAPPVISPRINPMSPPTTPPNRLEGRLTDSDGDIGTRGQEALREHGLPTGQVLTLGQWLPVLRAGS